MLSFAPIVHCNLAGILLSGRDARHTRSRRSSTTSGVVCCSRCTHHPLGSSVLRETGNSCFHFLLARVYTLGSSVLQRIHTTPRGGFRGRGFNVENASCREREGAGSRGSRATRAGALGGGLLRVPVRRRRHHPADELGGLGRRASGRVGVEHRGQRARPEQRRAREHVRRDVRALDDGAGGVAPAAEAAGAAEAAARCVRDATLRLYQAPTSLAHPTATFWPTKWLFQTCGGPARRRAAADRSRSQRHGRLRRRAPGQLADDLGHHGGVPRGRRAAAPQRPPADRSFADVRSEPFTSGARAGQARP